MADLDQSTESAPEADLAWTMDVHGRRVSVPTVLQMEATECGAACLAMILGHYQRWVPLEDLRVACGVSRDGANAHNMVLAGRAQGLIVGGFRRELEQLPDEPFPVIAFWRFSHFVVIEGVDKHGLLLNDPAVGRVRADWSEADRDFTGVVLRTAPGPDFARSGRAPSAWRGLGRRLGGTWSALIYLTIACLALAMPVALVPMALRAYVDRVVIDGITDWIPATLTTLVFAGAMTLWLTWWQGAVARRLGLALSQNQAIALVHHALRLPLSFFVQRYAGDTAFRVQLVDEVSLVASMQLIPAVVGLVTATVVGVTLLVYSWQLALVALAAGLAVVLTVRGSAQWRQSAAGRWAREQAAFSGSLAYGLRSIETVKSSGTEDDLFVLSSGRHARSVNALTRLSVSALALAALPTLTAGIASAVFVSAGGLLVMAQSLSPGGFVAALALLPLFLGPLGAWAGLGATLQQARASLDRLDDLLEYPIDPTCAASVESIEENEATGRSRVADSAEPSLELRNLTFGFSPSAPPLIRDLSLILSRGRRVGLVGMSGCGKSTVARMAVGLLQPWSGEVLLDGVPLPQVRRDLRVAQLGYVDQEIVLFPGTVRENITLFDASITDRQVVAAARGAGIHEEIAARPGSYDCAVSEGGSNFSGGQRQRIEIARAAAGSPALLVLDEATSALDPMKEFEVMEALAQSGAGLLIIAHRLSTVRDCDEILVMDQGQLVERGTHEELLARSGHYAAMVSL
ncbi:MAG: cysteine peptidase family C39 domain-containing protein [Candidatus Nanopelagicales bacterium]|nr:cysteine peptidase family C39 domain-containing protein [Candidatus Nanopelagicales bacterium]